MEKIKYCIPAIINIILTLLSLKFDTFIMFAVCYTIQAYAYSYCQLFFRQ